MEISFAPIPPASAIQVVPLYSTAQPTGNRNVLGEAKLDLSLKDLFNPITGGIIDVQIPFRPGAGEVAKWPLVEDMTDASLRYRLDQRINTGLYGPNKQPEIETANLYIDAVLRSAARLAQSSSLVSTPYDIGQIFAKTIAHEIGHRLGLLDEYIAP